MAYPLYAGSKKNRNRVFRINAQINAYLAKQLSGTSINSWQAAGKYDTRMNGKVGNQLAETGKKRTIGAEPNFLKQVVVQK
jgi:hypothetical protein